MTATDLLILPGFIHLVIIIVRHWASNNGRRALLISDNIRTCRRFLRHCSGLVTRLVVIQADADVDFAEVILRVLGREHMRL